MDGDRAFIPTGCAADPAGITIAFEDRFPKPTEILFVVTLERVTGSTKPQCQDLRLATAAGHGKLNGLIALRDLNTHRSLWPGSFSKRAWTQFIDDFLAVQTRFFRTKPG